MYVSCMLIASAVVLKFQPHLKLWQSAWFMGSHDSRQSSVSVQGFFFYLTHNGVASEAMSSVLRISRGTLSFRGHTPLEAEHLFHFSHLLVLIRPQLICFYQHRGSKYIFRSGLCCRRDDWRQQQRNHKINTWHCCTLHIQVVRTRPLKKSE